MTTAEVSRDVSRLPSAASAVELPLRRSGSYQPLVGVLAAVCVGIVCDRFVAPSFGRWWLVGLAAWFGWYGLWRRSRDRAAVVALLCSLAATGGAWHHVCWQLFAADELGLCARGDPGPICLEGQALSAGRTIHPHYDPLNTIPTGKRTQLDLRVTGVRDGDRWRAASGSTSVIVQGELLNVRAGDRLRIFGQLHRILGPSNPGEPNIAATARADRRLCLVRCKFAESVKTLSAGGWSFTGAVERLRKEGAETLARHLDPDESHLGTAMFLGLRQEVEPDVIQAFQATGTIHLLVIAGMHIWILAGFLLLTLRLFLVREGTALLITASAILLYAVVTGGQPPVVRATVMVLGVCLARFLGRRTSLPNTLAGAAIVILLINPCDLFGADTQLSFLGALAIAWSARIFDGQGARDPLERLIDQSRPAPVRAARDLGRRIWTVVLGSALIWLFVTPLVMERFHIFSPVGILVGPLLIIPVELAMASGFAVMLLGWLAPPLADVCGGICNANLRLIQNSVEWFRNLPGSNFWVPGPARWWLVGFYAGLLAILAAGRFRPPRRWCFALLAGWCAAGLGASWTGTRPADRLDCTFLSVGHGLAVVLQLPAGQTVLYDAGEIGAPQISTRKIAGYLWSRGITHLDAVVLSHADSDHYNALPGLLKQFSVGAVYVSTVMFDDKSPGVEALHSAIVKSGVPLREVWSGDRLRTAGDCRIEVLHPPRGGVLGNDNANCVVLAVEYQGRRILLTGDLEGPGLKELLAEEPIACDVLLVPHHGSTHSDPPGFADWSRPDWAIMSGGLGDRHPEVSDAYERRGSHVLHTANTGAVHVGIAQGKLEVDAWHGQADDPNDPGRRASNRVD